MTIFMDRSLTTALLVPAASDHNAQELAVLLARLDQRLTTHYTSTTPLLLRKKTKGNLQYARDLLLRLEHESASIKVASVKQAAQADLRAKRSSIKSLQTRIQSIDSMTRPPDYDESSSEDDGPPPPSQTAPPAPQSTLRVRNTAATKESTSIKFRTHATTSGHNFLPNSLSKSKSIRNSDADADTDTNTKSKDDVIAQDRAKRDQITEQMLFIAKQLRQSTAGFSVGLADSIKETDALHDTMDKNVSTMELARSKMSFLQKMTEGRGWFGRMKLYAYLAALWVLLLVIVFVLPKLRF